MELYVVRHGQTIVNVKELVNARNIIGINRVGKQQANIAAEQMEKVKIDLIFCSPLRRTKQTCKIINKNKVKVIYDKRLLERDSRSMQFKNAEKLDIEERYDVNKTIVYKNSEGFKSILDRVKKFLEEIKEKYALETLISMIDKKILEDKYKKNLNDATTYAESTMKSLEDQYGDQLEQTIAYYTGYQSIEAYKASLYLSHLQGLAVDDYSKSQIKDKDIKAYYMKVNPDNKTVAAVDLIVPVSGELMGGSQREENLDVLLKRMEEMHVEKDGIEWYLDTRRYGGCVHSGFGMGFERLIMYLTGIDNIRDVIPFPRTPKNCEY